MNLMASSGGVMKSVWPTHWYSNCSAPPNELQCRQYFAVTSGFELLLVIGGMNESSHVLKALCTSTQS
jgi:hypothetical protein